MSQDGLFGAFFSPPALEAAFVSFRGKSVLTLLRESPKMSASNAHRSTPAASRRISLVILVACLLAAYFASAAYVRALHNTLGPQQISRGSKIPSVGELDVPDYAYSVACSRDGRYIVVGSADLEPAGMLAGPAAGHLSSFSSRTRNLLADILTPSTVDCISLTGDAREVLIPSISFNYPAGYMFTLPNLHACRIPAGEPVIAPSIGGGDAWHARIGWTEVTDSGAKLVGTQLPRSLADATMHPNDLDVAVSPDLRLLAQANEWYVTEVGAQAGSAFIYIVDTLTGETIERIACPLQSTIAFVPGRQEIAGCAADAGTITAWNDLTGERLWASSPNLGEFRSVTASPSGAQILACNDSGFAVFDSATGGLSELVADASGYPAQYAASPEPAQRATYTADGKYILICDKGAVRIWLAPR
jgi:hypothetical protein